MNISNKELRFAKTEESELIPVQSAPVNELECITWVVAYFDQIYQERIMKIGTFFHVKIRIDEIKSWETVEKHAMKTFYMYRCITFFKGSALFILRANYFVELAGASLESF